MAKSLWTIPFGKFEGEDIEDVPPTYLQWLAEQEWFVEKFPEGLRAINKELEYRNNWE